jgi:carbamoyltransferase
MYILGVNAFHADSSAALLKDGRVIWATEEERFTRVKHWAGLPIISIDFCLKSEGISMSDVSYICIGRDPSVKQIEKLLYFLKHPFFALKLLFQRLSNRGDLKHIKKNIVETFGSCPKLIFVEHHRAHLASAFYSSEFNEATVISIDGSGDFSTVMIAKGNDKEIEVLESQNFPVSVGIFYSAFTQFLGFPYYGDEYKVMGLSPYGHPKYLDKLRSIIWVGKKNILEWDANYFNLNDGVIKYESNIPVVSDLFNKKTFEESFGKARSRGEEIIQRDKDLASSLQCRTEELIFEIIDRAVSLTGISSVCIAGGVAQNSVANGKIVANTKATSLYIPSAGHDAGISMGAAQFHYFNNLQFGRVEALYNANLGIAFNNNQVAHKLSDLGLHHVYMPDEELFKFIANKIANGNVIGFFDGQAEFGPRALGSRSILADPRNPTAQKLLNEKIKKRESFRPFAPSILEEYGEEYFENYQFTPFMERVLQIRKDKRHLVPAVTHVDGSGRLQSVRQSLRPRYHQLITEFHKITGIPILINTSFNENEPVVNIPEEAIHTFERTNLDILVIGNYILKK